MLPSRLHLLAPALAAGVFFCLPPFPSRAADTPAAKPGCYKIQLFRWAEDDLWQRPPIDITIIP